MTSRQQRTVLGMVLLVTVVEYGHRQLLALALVPIGVDLGVSDAALGALLTAFGLMYSGALRTSSAIGNNIREILRGKDDGLTAAATEPADGTLFQTDGCARVAARGDSPDEDRAYRPPRFRTQGRSPRRSRTVSTRIPFSPSQIA